MGFDGFILLSLFYAIIGVRVVSQIVAHRREIFDLRFTEADRALVQQAAFFVLVPISVALHEFGHAVAIWSLGGQVVDFGYFVFAGFVSYREPFTDGQRILVALAGPLVNVILSGAALAVVVLRRPPLRAAYNELLLQFAILSTANALVFYPLLDLVSGLNGDWYQMYFGGVPALSGAILIGHLGILRLGYWAWKDPRISARLATLTGAPRGTARSPMGRIRRDRDAMGGNGDGASSEEHALRAAGARVASGWPEPVDLAVQRHGTEVALVLAWRAESDLRSVVARATGTGGLELWGVVAPQPTVSRRSGPTPSPEPTVTTAVRRRLHQRASLPDVDALTLELRMAMEEVEGWDAPVASAP